LIEIQIVSIILCELASRHSADSSTPGKQDRVSKIFSEKALPTVIGFFVNATFVASDGLIIFVNQEIAFLNKRDVQGSKTCGKSGPTSTPLRLEFPENRIAGLGLGIAT
jgi:hypothetical protein